MPYDAQNQLVVMQGFRGSIDVGGQMDAQDRLANNEIISKGLLMKTVLFGLVFYIINNDLTKHLLNRFRTLIPVDIIQTVLFCIVFVLINISVN